MSQENMEHKEQSKPTAYACHGKQRGKDLSGTVTTRESKCETKTKVKDCKSDKDCTWKKNEQKRDPEPKQKEKQSESVITMDNYDPQYIAHDVNARELLDKQNLKPKKKSLKHQKSMFDPNFRKMDLEDIVKLIRKASDRYYNSSPIMTDQEFDTLRDYVEFVSPDHPVLKEIGAPIKSRKKKAKHNQDVLLILKI